MSERSGHYEWRYTFGGKVAHALQRTYHTAAVCGVGVWVSDQWLGTGSQREYERVEALPSCRRCLSKVIPAPHDEGK